MSALGPTIFFASPRRVLPLGSAVIYLDESGDLGWKLEEPYRQGGSSKHLSIAALLVASEDKHRPKRLIRRLYDGYGWDTNREKKWSRMNSTERTNFAQRASRLEASCASVAYSAITVRKSNVRGHIRADANKLYNYMIKLLLAKQMSQFDRVTLVPDARSIKVQSGNSLHDYLQTTLWLEMNSATELVTTPSDSSATLNLQFADMLAGLVQSHYEGTSSEPWNVIAKQISSHKLFF